MAPLAKPPGQRVRRNVDQPTWRQLPAEGREGKAPELPGEWLPSTLAWWATVWASPMAAAYLEADVDPLRRLAKLRDAFELGELPVSAYSAMQALEDRYGLSPKARRALQWEVSKADEPASGSRPGSGESRGHLRAV